MALPPQNSQRLPGLHTIVVFFKCGFWKGVFDILSDYFSVVTVNIISCCFLIAKPVIVKWCHLPLVRAEDVVLELQQKASKIASDDWTDISAVRIFSS